MSKIVRPSRARFQKKLTPFLKPMVRAVRSNFENSFVALEAALKDAQFVAIDEEMTGMVEAHVEMHRFLGTVFVRELAAVKPEQLAQDIPQFLAIAREAAERLPPSAQEQRQACASASAAKTRLTGSGASTGELA